MPCTESTAAPVVAGVVVPSAVSMTGSFISAMCWRCSRCTESVVPARSVRRASGVGWLAHSFASGSGTSAFRSASRYATSASPSAVGHRSGSPPPAVVSQKSSSRFLPSGVFTSIAVRLARREAGAGSTSPRSRRIASHSLVARPPAVAGLDGPLAAELTAPCRCALADDLLAGVEERERRHDAPGVDRRAG